MDMLGFRPTVQPTTRSDGPWGAAVGR
ncbi:hypothetical protein [Fodinicola acaciae]